MDQLAAPGEQARLSMLRVHFSPGARTNWHEHPRGQVLHVVDGVGRIQVRGEEVQTLSLLFNLARPLGNALPVLSGVSP